MPLPSIDPDVLQDAIEAGQFECARCGHCCKGDGLVQFNTAQAKAMCAELKVDMRTFEKEYAIKTGLKEWILRDKIVKGVGPRGEDEKWCTFLERDAQGLYLCRVNTAKPAQCGEFPRTWRNSDSLVTCVGLRALVAALRRAATAEGEQE